MGADLIDSSDTVTDWFLGDATNGGGGGGGDVVDMSVSDAGPVNTIMSDAPAANTGVGNMQGGSGLQDTANQMMQFNNAVMSWSTKQACASMGQFNGG